MGGDKVHVCELEWGGRSGERGRNKGGREKPTVNDVLTDGALLRLVSFFSSV